MPHIKNKLAFCTPHPAAFVSTNRGGWLKIFYTPALVHLIWNASFGCVLKRLHYGKAKFDKFCEFGSAISMKMVFN